MDSQPTDDLSLRLAVLEARFLAAEEAGRQRQQASAEALTLYANENARRLELLNGEASRLRLMQENYVPRETYSSERGRLIERQDADTRRNDDRFAMLQNQLVEQNLIITEIKARLTTSVAGISIMILMVGTISTVIALVARFWK